MSISTYPSRNRCDSGLIEDFCGSQLDAIMLVAKNMSLLQQIPQFLQVAQSVYDARDDAIKAEQGAIAAMDGVPAFAELALYSMNIFPNVDIALSQLPNGAFFMIPAADDKPQDFGYLYQIQANLARPLKTIPSNQYIAGLQTQITAIQNMLNGYGFVNMGGYVSLLLSLPTVDTKDPNTVWNNNGIITQGSGSVTDNSDQVATDIIDAISIKMYLHFINSLPTSNPTSDPTIIWNDNGKIMYGMGTNGDPHELDAVSLLKLMQKLPTDDPKDGTLWNNDGVATEGTTNGS